jgi:hypothetical protein
MAWSAPAVNLAFLRGSTANLTALLRGPHDTQGEPLPHERPAELLSLGPGRCLRQAKLTARGERRQDGAASRCEFALTLEETGYFAHCFSPQIAFAGLIG